jgi:hypothetical protein
VGGWEARERLVSVLADIDAVADEDLARAALTVVAKCPRVVVGLDWHVRNRTARRSEDLVTAGSLVNPEPPGAPCRVGATAHSAGQIRVVRGVSSK